MSRYPDFHTASGIARRLAEGRGSGAGPTYKPYFTRFDLRSTGERRETFSSKCGRSVHLLSRLEYRLFLLAQFDPAVCDIREQYPLPLQQTLPLAKRLGIRHPRYWRTDCEVVMTTDFLLTKKSSDGTTYTEAWSGKYADSLRHWRTAEKQFLEHRWHIENDHRWHLKTERDIPQPYADNLAWLHPLQRRDAILGYPVDLPEMVDEVMRALLRSSEDLLWRIAHQCDEILGFRNRDVSLYICRYLLATGRWRADLRTWNRSETPLKLLS